MISRKITPPPLLLNPQRWKAMSSEDKEPFNAMAAQKKLVRSRLGPFLRLGRLGLGRVWLRHVRCCKRQHTMVSTGAIRYWSSCRRRLGRVPVPVLNCESIVAFAGRKSSDGEQAVDAGDRSLANDEAWLKGWKANNLKHGATASVRTHLSKGAHNEREGKYAQALSDFEIALGSVRKMHNDKTTMALLGKMGALCNEMHLYSRAGIWFTEYLRLVQTTGDSRLCEGRAYDGLGKAFLARGQNRAARLYFTEWLRVAKLEKSVMAMNRAAAGLADCLIADGLPVQAMPIVRGYLRVSEEGLEMKDQVLAWGLLGKAQTENNDMLGACESHAKELACCDELIRNFSPQSLGSPLSGSDDERKLVRLKQNSRRKLAEALHEAHRHSEAFEFFAQLGPIICHCPQPFTVLVIQSLGTMLLVLKMRLPKDGT